MPSLRIFRSFITAFSGYFVILSLQSCNFNDEFPETYPELEFSESGCIDISGTYSIKSDWYIEKQSGMNIYRIGHLRHIFGLNKEASQYANKATINQTKSDFSVIALINDVELTNVKIKLDGKKWKCTSYSIENIEHEMFIRHKKTELYKGVNNSLIVSIQKIFIIGQYNLRISKTKHLLFSPPV